MANVFNVARYILKRTGKVSTWKLQKLCYYSQAWSVAWTDRPLFNNRIEAWRNGPVCPELFHSHQGKYCVELSDIPESFEDKINPLTDDEIDTINHVLDYYQNMEPFELRELTHSEAPWQEVRNGLPENSPSQNEITIESMAEYYGGLYEQEKSKENRSECANRNSEMHCFVKGSDYMASVFDVSEYILDKLQTTTAMKLEKLCYYCQAWSLAWDDKPLFEEDFQAWGSGPVCPELFDRHHGKFVLNAGDIKGSGYRFTPEELETMDAVLDYYGDKEPHWISELTHQERPWREARGFCAPGERCTNVISKESMQDYYGGLQN